jgi:hypothetical protein
MRDSMFQPQATEERGILFGRAVQNIPSVLSEDIKLADIDICSDLEVGITNVSNTHSSSDLERCLKS